MLPRLLFTWKIPKVRCLHSSARKSWALGSCRNYRIRLRSCVSFTTIRKVSWGRRQVVEISTPVTSSWPVIAVNVSGGAGMALSVCVPFEFISPQSFLFLICCLSLRSHGGWGGCPTLPLLFRNVFNLLIHSMYLYWVSILFFISWASLIAQLQWRSSWFDSWVGKLCWRRDRLLTPVFLGFPCGSAGKESASNVRDLGLILGLGRSPGEGNGYPLQNSGLENSMDYSMGLQRVRCHWVTFTFILF